MKRLGQCIFIGIVVLLITSCAVKPIVIQGGGYTFYQDSQENVQKLCVKALRISERDLKGKIYGCWLPKVKAIIFEKDNWCIATHELLHALIGGWHYNEPNGSCGLGDR